MGSSVHYMASRIMDDACFIYTALAFVRGADDEEQPAFVLAKVGISSRPMQRLTEVNSGCPFPIDFAAFAPVGRTSRARKAESRILKAFRKYKTRGEWMLLPNSEEVKKEFAMVTRAIIADVSGRPTEWRRVSGSEISSYSTELLSKNVDSSSRSWRRKKSA